jgi:hypothetical protein
VIDTNQGNSHSKEKSSVAVALNLNGPSSGPLRYRVVNLTKFPADYISQP